SLPKENDFTFNLLLPFIKIFSKIEDKVFLKIIKEEIFEKLTSDEYNCFNLKFNINLNLEKISKTIFKIGSQSFVLHNNRKEMYSISNSISQFLGTELQLLDENENLVNDAKDSTTLDEKKEEEADNKATPFAKPKESDEDSWEEVEESGDEEVEESGDVDIKDSSEEPIESPKNICETDINNDKKTILKVETEISSSNMKRKIPKKNKESEKFESKSKKFKVHVESDVTTELNGNEVVKVEKKKKVSINLNNNTTKGKK
ncbi:hypothetical protein HK099_002447, partial [Clydaea vesicula]